MRGCDLTPGEPNWLFRPSWHKNTWRGKDRVIVVGPEGPGDRQGVPQTRSQAVPLRSATRSRATTRTALDEEVKAHSIGNRQEEEGQAGAGSRRSLLTGGPIGRPSSVPAIGPSPSRPVADRAKKMTDGERRELKEWRRKHRWSPLRLRHTAATIIRSRFGLEASQVVLGHAKADVTQIYAARDLAKAHAVMAEMDDGELEHWRPIDPALRDCHRRRRLALINRAIARRIISTGAGSTARGEAPGFVRRGTTEFPSSCRSLVPRPATEHHARDQRLWDSMDRQREAGVRKPCRVPCWYPRGMAILTIQRACRRASAYGGPSSSGTPVETTTRR